MGGGKGGSDFDPKGKSDAEVMRFCQSFMTELYQSHRTSSPTFPQATSASAHAKLVICSASTRRSLTAFEGGVITGKGLTFGGSLARTQATGYGLCYFTQQRHSAHLANTSFEGKKVIVSGAGNVAHVRS